MRTALVALFIVCLAQTPSASEGAPQRSKQARAEFVRANPCPSTGKTRGPCAGHVVDHVTPLCAGGADAPGNMAWQTVEAAKEKDRLERAMCRRR